MVHPWAKYDENPPRGSLDFVLTRFSYGRTTRKNNASDHKNIPFAVAVLPDFSEIFEVELDDVFFFFAPVSAELMSFEEADVGAGRKKKAHEH